jgi:hypothetical protein
MENRKFAECPIHSAKRSLLSAKGFPRIALHKGLSVEILLVKGVFVENRPLTLGKRVPSVLQGSRKVFAK